MYYIVSFDGCGIESPLQARSAEATLALAQEAEKNGCQNVVVQVPAGDVLTLEEFAAEYCGRRAPAMPVGASREAPPPRARAS
jgi:hypothetical protein